MSTEEIVVPVSVVMPAHRRPEILRRALASLWKQTYPHDRLEVIVVATEGDGSAEVVADEATKTDISARCLSIPNDPAGGRNPSAKRNYGVQQARGEWIAFIDDDCVADPQWIAGAAPFFADPNVGGVEGRKEIPAIDPPTRTYRGLLNFTKPGGYQTCNMFYQRKTFLDLKGFDIDFPFYLEDTDLAWTLLDRGFAIPHAKQAVVLHPVNSPEPWRLMNDAKLKILMPYLYRKHKKRYRSNRIRALRPAHWAYIVLYAGILLALAARFWIAAGCIAAMVPVMEAGHLYKLFHGCTVRRDEFWVAALLLPIMPVVAVVQLVRGNLRYGVWLFT